MSEQDSLRGFQFPRTKGLYVSFDDGDEYKLRVLTTDPVVTQKEFEGENGEINLTTKFAFVVWNWTLEKAQILNAGATITREIQRIHQDEDFGANIKKVDIKISATGSKLSRRYAVNVLPASQTLTNEQIKQCQEIDLDAKIVDGQRMSFYNPAAAAVNKVDEVVQPDEVVADIPEEPIDLSDIPF